MIDRDLARRLGGRHLLAELESKLGTVSDQANHSVRLVTSTVMADTLAGQHLIWMLANLLARQFAIVHKIEIQIPPNVAVRSQAVLFPIAAAKTNLADAIATTVTLIAADTIEVVIVDSADTQVDFEVFIGYDNSSSSAPYSLGVYADGWNLYVGDPSTTPAMTPVSAMPFGPYFAACIAAAEVFKFFRKLKAGAGSFARNVFLSLWNFQVADAWEDLPKTTDIPVYIPPFYLAGAGAVGQALACTLAAAPCEDMYVTVIDHDKIDDEGTNLNRCPLATQEDIGAMKSVLTAECLCGRSIDVFIHENKWEHYLDSNNRRPQRADVAALECDLKYPIIVSCVDKNPARHALQKCWPEYLIGGSTNGMGIEVSSYDMESMYECLMCFNPLPKVSSIEEAAARFKGLTSEEQKNQAKQFGIDLDSILQYLDSPECGSIAENELRKFADAERAPRASVGFVSVGAGVVLAVQLVKYAREGRSTFSVDLGNSIRFNFLEPSRFRWSKHRRKDKCECSNRGRDTYHRLWDIS